MCRIIDDFIAEGMEKGAYNAKVETAQNLRRMGMSSEQISLATGLPENEINNIK